MHMNLNQHVKAILSKCNHINHLKQLQSFLTTLGHSQTQFYAFKLVRFCLLNLTNTTYARSIFDSLHSSNVYLYTAMITSYAASLDHGSAFALFRAMVRRGDPRPNQFIYPHVLRSGQVTNLVHTHVLKSGFDQYPVVQTALVGSYADVEDSRKVFDEMCEKSVVSWTAMVSGYTRAGEIEKAVSLFEKMPERDVPSWNAVISGCAQNGLFAEAIRIFREMAMVFNERPNQVTLVCALSSCGQSGMLHLGKLIHGYICRNELLPDIFVSNALVDMYGKCGSLREAERIFWMTSKKSLTAWNSMINCFALHGHDEKAICVFEELRLYGGDGLRPDEVTFVGLLNACTHAGLVDEARSYFQMMIEDYGIEPQIEHYGCLIDILGRAGRFEEALGVLRSMKIEPDEVVWGSLLNGCKIHGNRDLAEFAVKKLIDIDPKNGGYGIMLANLYGEQGKWDDVRKVRKMLKDQCAYKTPGCSWIEVDNEVRQFYSVDKTHPRTEEIYETLDTLFQFF